MIKIYSKNHYIALLCIEQMYDLNTKETIWAVGKDDMKQNATMLKGFPSRKDAQKAFNNAHETTLLRGWQEVWQGKRNYG